MNESSGWSGIFPGSGDFKKDMPSTHRLDRKLSTWRCLMSVTMMADHSS